MQKSFEIIKIVISLQHQKQGYTAKQNVDDLVTDSVAQLVEQYTFNVWVLGSNPSRVTSKNIINLL